jgi:hypothetical protein
MKILHVNKINKGDESLAIAFYMLYRGDLLCSQKHILVRVVHISRHITFLSLVAHHLFPLLLLLTILHKDTSLMAVQWRVLAGREPYERCQASTYSCIRRKA